MAQAGDPIRSGFYSLHRAPRGLEKTSCHILQGLVLQEVLLGTVLLLPIRV